jgi:CheY-like chemotaxis protein
MPEMDGFEAAQRIKRIPGCDDIPLVFVTAVHHEDPSVRRGYAVGAVDYFSKPLDPSLLRLKVDVYPSFRHRANLLRIREQQLRQSEEVRRAARKLGSALEGLPVGVIVTDVAGRVCQTSEGALRILEPVSGFDGGARGEVVDWWQRHGAALHRPLARSGVNGESTHNTVVRVQCLDGTTKNLFQSASPLRGLDGAVVGTVVVLQDMTEPTKVEADFEEHIKRLVSLAEKLEDATPSRLLRVAGPRPGGEV